MIALGFLVLVVFVAIAAPVLAPHDMTATSAAHRLRGAGSTFWLGTDDLGRDMLSRVIFASRTSMWAASVAILVALTLSLPLGMISGYKGGSKIDTVIQRTNDGLMTFPSLVLAIGVIGILGPGLTKAMAAIGLSLTPQFVRVIRAATLSVREEAYVEAAHQVGSPVHRIIIGHVLPNILSPVIVQTTLSFGLAILAESVLSFLGLGAQPPMPSWGGMLGRGFRFMYAQPLNILVPGAAIVLVVYSVNILGEGINRAVGREFRHVS